MADPLSVARTGLRGRCKRREKGGTTKTTMKTKKTKKVSKGTIGNTFSKQLKAGLFTFTFKVVRWLVLTSCKTSLPLHHFESLCNKLQRVLKNNGLQYTIKYIKAIRGNFYNYLSGNPLRNSLARSTSDGIPVVLGDLIALVRGRHMRAIALILTILTATRSLKIISTPDLDTITQPVKGEVPDISKHMRSFWSILGYRPILEKILPRKLKANFQTYRLSKGPNGRSLNTALSDIQYMSPELMKSLGKMSMKTGSVLREFSDPDLSWFFEQKFKKHFNTQKCCRRLSVFPDKEGKMRVIGVLDHYSQVTLEPLHNYLAKVLSKIRQDCTLDQSKFKSLLLDRKDVDCYYSVDLSSATDRFPISVISKLLKHQLPSGYVDAWENVMVGTPFDYRGQQYTYAAGNPMGAYSSFNSFALAHHYLIYYCCKELGVNWKSLPYSLLGDDVVIGNSKVGEMYMKLITDLHVEYSPAKTHKSKEFFEFAKRIFYNGEEVSPFPISSIKENRKTISGFTNLLLEQKVRGWEFVTVSSSANLFYKSVLDLPSRLAATLEKRVKNAEGVLSLVRGLQDGEQFMNEFANTLQLPLPHINMEICKNIIANIAVDVFSQSSLHTFFSSNDVDKLPMMQSVSNFRREWEEYVEDNFYDRSAFEILKAKHLFTDTPMYLAVKAIHKEYKELMARLEKIDSTGSDWSYYMRNFALPTNSKSIIDGGQFQVMRSVDRFSDLIGERLQIIAMYPQLLEM